MLVYRPGSSGSSTSRSGVPQVVGGVAVEVQLRALVGREAGQHLVEDVVVALAGRRPHHARLVQEVAVDLGAVQRAVRHLHLDEVALEAVGRSLDI